MSRLQLAQPRIEACPGKSRARGGTRERVHGKRFTFLRIHSTASRPARTVMVSQLSQSGIGSSTVMIVRRPSGIRSGTAAISARGE